MWLNLVQEDKQIRVPYPPSGPRIDFTLFPAYFGPSHSSLFHVPKQEVSSTVSSLQ